MSLVKLIMEAELQMNGIEDVYNQFYKNFVVNKPLKININLFQMEVSINLNIKIYKIIEILSNKCQKMTNLKYLD